MSVKLAQYLDNLICNQNLKWKQSNSMLWNHKHPYLKEILLFAEERAILHTIKRKNTLASKVTAGKGKFSKTYMLEINYVRVNYLHLQKGKHTLNKSNELVQKRKNKVLGVTRCSGCAGSYLSSYRSPLPLVV